MEDVVGTSTAGSRADALTPLRGAKVLLTGHTGFKGAWAAQWLHQLGARVSGFALAPLSEPSLYTLARVASLLEHEAIADLNAPGAYAAFHEEVQPDVVVHMAAQSLVPTGYEAPLATWETNTMGTARVLDAVRAAAAPCAVVVVTTDKCYAHRDAGWGFREDDPFGGDDPYSASKAGAELVVHSYRQSFFQDSAVRLASGRAGNVIGGGDWSDRRLVVDIVRAWLAGTPVTLRNPNAVRPWQHVLDPVFGYLLLAARLLDEAPERFATGFNFGPAAEDAVSVGALVARMSGHWPENAGFRALDAPPFSEAEVLRLVTQKAFALLGWTPGWGLDEALRRTVDWYRAADANPGAAAALCRAQIDDFARLPFAPR